MTQHPALSVIVPTLNEEASIADVLDDLRAQKDVRLQVIVADGGSKDATVSIARNRKVEVVSSRTGRGAQMNHGAAHAEHDMLLFLHCDSSMTRDDLLADALNLFCEASATDLVAGHFSLEFETNDPLLKKKLRFFETKTELNRPGTFNGDQGLLIRKKDFDAMGGFTETFTFLEDQDFGNRFIEKGAFKTLPGKLKTSARRFEQEGFRPRVIMNTLIMGMFHLGLHDFFDRGKNIYRHELSRTNPAPFFALAFRSLFLNGVFPGLHRCYRIGKYGTDNLWQVFLYWGLEGQRIHEWLSIHDRYVKKLARNPLGYLIGTIIIAGWFFSTWIYLALKSGRGATSRRAEV